MKSALMRFFALWSVLAFSLGCPVGAIIGDDTPDGGASGDGDGDGDGDIEAECSTDGDCRVDEECVEDQCLTPSSSGTTHLCSTADPCPTGQFCFNGICAIGCNSDGDCANNQYCDTTGSRLCVNREVASCPGTPCEANQTCIDGLCSAGSVATECNANAIEDDGCDAYSLCLETAEDEVGCVTFPPCPKDEPCPVGLRGSVCNEGFIEDKERICLSSLCSSDVNCPSSWTCVKFGYELGVCSNGQFGEICTAAQDVCVDDLACSVLIPGGVGICFTDTTTPPANTCSSLGGSCVDFASCMGAVDVTATDCGISEVCCL